MSKEKKEVKYTVISPKGERMEMTKKELADYKKKLKK